MKHLMKVQNQGSTNGLMQFSAFGYMWTTPNKKLIASHSIYEMLEKPPFVEFLTIEKWRSIVHPKDLYKLLLAEEELLHTGNPTVAEYRLITDTGRHIYVNHHMYLSGHTEQKIMSIVHDVTDQKNAEVILQAMNEGFFEVDESFKIRRINLYAISFWNLDNEDVNGKDLFEIFPQMQGTEFYDLLAKAITERTNLAQDIIDPVTTRWLHVSITPYSNRLIIIFYDLQNEKDAENKAEEDRKLLEAAKAAKILFEAEQKYRRELEKKVEDRTRDLEEQTHLLSHVAGVLPDLLSIIELDTMKASYINKKVLFEMGFDDLDKMTNEERAEIIYPDDRPLLKKYFDSFADASNDEVIDIEYRAKIKTGEWHWFHAKGKVFARNEFGKPTHCVNIVQNIDKRKRYEQQIERLNYNLLVKNEQLNSLNSELRQLNTITANNYTEALRHVYINLETIVTTDARNLSNSSRANLRRAQAAIQKMKLLSNDINNYLQLYETRINKETIDPNLVVLDALNFLSRKIEETNAKINVDKLSLLNTDAVLFSKLMTHLIDNSIKFGKENTEPIVNISESMIDHVVDHKLVQAKPFIVISVSDNGIGFEKNETIFEPFMQLNEHGKHKGAGMGLAICKKIMEMHGGFITADAKPEEGATFNCYFPA